MKKKLLAIFLIAIMLLTSCFIVVIAATLTYARTGGSNLSNIAPVINDNIYIDADYTAASRRITNSNLGIYRYNTMTALTCAGSDAIIYSNNRTKYYYTTFSENGTDTIYYTIKLASGDQVEQNIATFIFKNGISYGGKNYDVKLNIKEIKKIGGEQEFHVVLGRRNSSNSDRYNLSTYSQTFNPEIGMKWSGSATQMEVKVEYYILDGSGNEISVSGLMGLTDIDLNQGIFIDNYKAARGNVYMQQNKSEETIKYKIMGNGTFIYSSTSDNTSGDHAYILLKDRSKLDMAFTFDSKQAYSTIYFTNGVIKRYKKITTSVTGGTVTGSITGIKDGESKTITYSPNNSTTQYLKSVTVDGREVSTSTYANKYTFSNITENHTIAVAYANKCKVTFNSNGGNYTPALQYVVPGGKATKPSTDPTKTGYTFGGWKLSNTTSSYNFNTAVNSDITLTAIWNPRTDTVYKVEHYKKNASGSYVLADTENKTGTTDATVTATAKTYTGFKENTTYSGRKASGTVAANGSLVLKLYYDEVTYTISYTLNEGTNDSLNPTTYTVLKTETFKDATRQGYDFKGWYEDSAFTESKKITSTANKAENLMLYAKWQARTDTPYRVEHYKSDRGATYKLEDTDNLQGETDKTARAVPKNYTGYKENTTYSGRKAFGNIEADGSLVLKLYYDSIIYNINYVLNGGVNDDSNPSTYTIEDVFDFKFPTKIGYDFDGWYEDSEFNTNIEGVDHRTGDITLYAKWKARTDTKYTVMHYKKEKDGKYKVAVKDFMQGETDSKVTAIPKEFAGYVENIEHPGRENIGIVKADGTLILKLYYAPIIYQIEYETNGGKNNDENPKTYTITDIVNFKPASKEGYEFHGWYEDKDCNKKIDSIVNRTGDIKVYAKWEAKKDTEYKVEYYKKNKKGEYELYELVVTDNLTGVTDTIVTANEKEFEGYIENIEYIERKASGRVTADGNLVLRLYYDPIVYKINYVLNGGKNNENNPSTYTVEDEIDFWQATKEGYDFMGWYEDEDFNTKIDSIVNRTGDITVYAKWKARTDIPYKVEHYKEGKDGKYELVVTERCKGEADAEVTAVPRNYREYNENTKHPDRLATAKIKPDGSLILKLYYERVTYKVTFDPQNGKKVEDQIVRYEETAKEPNKQEKEGYEFKYWYYIDKNGKKVVYDFNTPVVEDIHLIAEWELAKDDTVAPDPIPQTGILNNTLAAIGILVIGITAIFSIKYFKLRDIKNK